MRAIKRILAASLVAAALLVTSLGLTVTERGMELTAAVSSAAAVQADPAPKEKSMGQLLDEGYTCSPIGGGIVQCYRDKNSPKYECRVNGCSPVDIQGNPGHLPRTVGSGGVLTQQP